eukprot:4141393-Prymnesium_polylepis.1
MSVRCDHRRRVAGRRCALARVPRPVPVLCRVGLGAVGTPRIDRTRILESSSTSSVRATSRLGSGSGHGDPANVETGSQK